MTQSDQRGKATSSRPRSATEPGAVWFQSRPYGLAWVSQGHDAGASQGLGSPYCSKFPWVLVFGVREMSVGWDPHTALAL